jgi:ADP-heptose:LPS heptosyltransferase
LKPTRPRAVTPNPRSTTIAVLATHWLGDTLWALQIIPFLRRAHPAARIELFVRADLEWLGRLWLPADRVHALRSLVSDRRREGLPRPWRILAEARRERPELLIDLTNTPAAALFTWALRPGFAIGAGSRRAVSRPFDSWRDLRAFSGHLALRPWWVIEPAYGTHPLWPPPESRLRPVLPGVERAPEDGPILFFPGAGWPTKRWPLTRFVELARRIAEEGRAVELLFAPAERAFAAEASGMNAAGKRIRARVCEGVEMLELLRRAPAVVSNDSGAAHLAAALGVPTVALFGPTNPAFCGPLGPRARVLRAACPDRPEGSRHHCGDRAGRPCDRGCLETIGADEVHRALADLLGP